MNYEDLMNDLEAVIRNLRGDGSAALELADNQRRKIIAAVLIACVHFGILLVGHVILAMRRSDFWIVTKNSPPPLFSPPNAIWGVCWILLLVVIAVLRGGWAVHGPFLGMILMPTHEETGQHGEKYQTNAAESIARVYVGFVAIEFVVNMFFNSTPFFGSELGRAMFVTLLSPVAAYFLIRWLARKSINWENWVKLPLWNIGITVGIMFLEYFREKYPTVAGPLAGWAAHPTFGIGTLFVIGVILLVGSSFWSD